MSTEPRPQTRRTLISQGGRMNNPCNFFQNIAKLYLDRLPVIAIARTSGLHITQPLIALLAPQEDLEAMVHAPLKVCKTHFLRFHSSTPRPLESL